MKNDLKVEKIVGSKKVVSRFRNVNVLGIERGRAQYVLWRPPRITYVNHLTNHQFFTKPWELYFGYKLRIENMFFDLTRERYFVHFRIFVKSYPSTSNLHQTMKNIILSQKTKEK